MNAYVPAYTCILTCTCAWIYTYIHTHTYIHTYIHACIYIHTYIHAYIHIHKCVHTYIHTYIHHHRHHHHHITVMQLGHWLTRSAPTYPEVFNVLPCFLLPIGEECFITLGSLLRGILFTCCIQFLLYSSNLYKIGVIFYSFVICFVICPSVSCCSSHVLHLCCCYSSGVPCFNGPRFASV